MNPQRTKDLIIEYDTLKGKIGDVNTPSEELAKARERLMEVEEKLIELNPDILKAEDAKSGKFREQLGLADRLNDTRNKAAKRDLEKAAIDNETKLPELQKEYERLSDNLKTYNQAYSDAKESYVKYQEYVSQQQSISQNLSGAEQANGMQKLMNQIREETGKY
jgi:chromosome segregation ATPase